MDPITADCFRSDPGVAQETVDAGVSTGRAQGANTSWEKWSSFVRELALDSLLKTVGDKVSILQVFARRVCTGGLAANQNLIRS